MREAVRQTLLMHGIEVDKKDYPYVEVQVQLIRQLEKMLADADLRDTVPALVYRAAEVYKE